MFSWIFRTLTGRSARRTYLLLVVVLIATSAASRIYMFVLTRRMQAVIVGLSKLRIDQSTEEEVARSVPQLARSQWEGPLKRSPETGEIDLGIERVYSVEISNESSWIKFGRVIDALKLCSRNARFTHDGYVRGCIFLISDWLGFRYAHFGASVVLLNGRVSSIRYGVADRLVFPRQIGEIVSARSVHGFWASYRDGFAVRSTDDESPQFRVSSGTSNLGVTYTVDAPAELVAHAFRVDLSCFWSLHGCRSPAAIARARARSGRRTDTKHDIGPPKEHRSLPSQDCNRSVQIPN